MHNYANMRSKQIVINTCQILPFFTISMPAKWPIFLDFANSLLPLKTTPFFAKFSTIVKYVLVGSVGFGVGRSCLTSSLSKGIITAYTVVSVTYPSIVLGIDVEFFVF